MYRPNLIGQTLGGRYRLDDIIGQGGMSAVYKAYDPNLKRVVAIKMIHPHLAEDPKFVFRFEEEAAAVAQLRHANIVQVFDFNHDDNLYYMVQEFVAGETLQQRLRRLNKSNRRMPLDESIGYITNICNASGYAHARGLVHRDIKPANIMIDIHGQAILMDFGIVKIIGGEKHTATGAVVGTALYLPPELIRGEIPDSRSDQYSLAVTLFECVTGRPPFEADSAMTLMMMHLNDPLPDLHQLRPDVPANLIAVIEKALSKNREERYASMAEFAGALRNVLATLTNHTPAATLADQPGALAADPMSVRGGLAGGVPPQTTTVEKSFSKPSESTRVEGFSPGVPSRGDQDGVANILPGPPDVAIPKPSSPNLALWGGIAGVILIVLILIFFMVRGRSTPPPAALIPTSALTTPTQLAQVVAPTSIATATQTPTITLIPPPTLTPTITLSPTPTIPVGVPYSRINAITINDRGFYLVDYETFEYTEILPGQHVHFFFNTVTQEQAGHPGNGPWILYGGPRPFERYNTADRPAAATQLCIRVANADHSIQLNSGNCFTLPDVNAAVPIMDLNCLAGPGPIYPVLSQLSAGQVFQVTGISLDEAWWTIDSPKSPGQSCWLPRGNSNFSGDLSTLPPAEVPPTPEGSLVTMSVQISRITIDTQGRYVVEFNTGGFTPSLPGTHIHFFFDIFSSEQVSATGGGNRLMYGGVSPFTGYAEVDRPQNATQLCALVANPDHSVITDSGNCIPLP